MTARFLTGVFVVALLAACGSESDVVAGAGQAPSPTLVETATTVVPPTMPPSITASTVPATTSTTAIIAVAPSIPTAPAVAVAPSVPTATIPATALTPPVPVALRQAGSAGQAILVSAGSYGATSATLSAYEQVDGAWRHALGPWTANIGRQGFAPPGEKREGDGRTPSGVYGFEFLFGVDPDPGVQLSYRRIVDDSIVWVDDPASPLYNQWVDRDLQDPGTEPEPMNVGAYRYGAVIGYNTARTPGLGSAIFLHVSTGGATAGCVSLPTSQLLEVLRWLDPARQPRIVMGVGG